MNDDIKPGLEKPKRGKGRPKFVPTDEERKRVEGLAGYGVPFAQIAALVRDGIHEETLGKHFSKELVAGKAKANSKVGQTLFQRVMDGDTTAAIWWTKTQMGWRGTDTHEHTGASTAPITIEIRRTIVDPKHGGD